MTTNASKPLPPEPAPSDARPPSGSAPAPADAKADNRQVILEAALTVFGKMGYEGATTRKIAELAKVNHAMINYYYQTKEQLWKDSVNYLFERLDRNLSLTLDDITRFGNNPKEFAKELLRRYVRYIGRQPEHARIMIQECLREGPRLTWAADAHIKGNIRYNLALIKLLQQSGSLPDASPMALHYILAGAAQLAFILAPEAKLVWDKDTCTDDYINEHIEAMIALIFREPPVATE